MSDQILQIIKSSIQLTLFVYKSQAQKLLVEREQMAAVHHQLSFALRQAHKRIDDLELELEKMKQQLVEAKRNSVTLLK